MQLKIPDVLTKEQVGRFRARLDRAEWVDGRVTAGYQSAQAKDNMQLREEDPVARELGELILQALANSPLFVSAALPMKVFPPLFNRYQGGQSFGNHIDNAIRQIRGTPHRLRSDLSATLFLTEPEDYEGGELSIQELEEVRRIKLPAGHLLLYPATSLHHVVPVTRGARVSAFFWIQSMVRDEGERRLLFDLDRAIQQVSLMEPAGSAPLELTKIYHNLLRRWADA